MLIQGYMIDTSNIMMLPYMNRDNFRTLRDKLKRLSPKISEEFSVPVLRSLMTNKTTAYSISDAVTELLGRNASQELMKTLKDLPILTVKTIVRTSEMDSVPCTFDQNCISMRLKPQTQCIFELNIFRDGSNKMNVYSKKFNKQKEEFWFLIFIEGDSLSFRKFSFSKRMKKIEIPVEMPLQRGKFSVM